MKLDILVDGQLKKTWQCHDPVQSQSVEFDVDKTLEDSLQIDMCCSGKDQKRDSQVVHDVLIADKAIVLDSVVVNGVKIEPEIYLFPYVTQDGTCIERTAYFGFNGTYTLPIQPDLVTWLSECRDRLGNTPVMSDYEQFIKEIMQ